MQGHKVFKPIVRLAAAVVLAGVIAFAVSAAPAANDHSGNGGATQETPPQPFAKTDRLPLAVKGAACSSRGWPDFEPKCQFDIRENAGEARAVRIIALR